MYRIARAIEDYFEGLAPNMLIRIGDHSHLNPGHVWAETTRALSSLIIC